MKKKAHSTATRLGVPVLGLALALSACQKQEDQSGAEQQTSPLAERATELQEKAEETATKAVEKTREAGEAISEKALSQPEPMPSEESDSER